jgi:hypothetical protein
VEVIESILGQKLRSKHREALTEVLTKMNEVDPYWAEQATEEAIAATAHSLSLPTRAAERACKCELLLS